VSVPELDLQRIKKWCVAETSPLHADELRVEADVTATAVTIVETRPPWDGSAGGRGFPSPASATRQRQECGLSTGGTDTFGSIAMTGCRLAGTWELLDVVADSGDPIFWG
jgi:hypothetical protein